MSGIDSTCRMLRAAYPHGLSRDVHSFNKPVAPLYSKGTNLIISQNTKITNKPDKNIPLVLAVIHTQNFIGNGTMSGL